MTETWMWGLIASLILLAIGTTLKSAHDAFILKKSDQEIARLRSEIEALKKSKNEPIPCIEKVNSAIEEKFTNAKHDLLTQNHSGSGDNVGGNKIINNISHDSDNLIVHQGLRTRTS